MNEAPRMWEARGTHRNKAPRMWEARGTHDKKAPQRERNPTTSTSLFLGLAECRYDIEK